MKTIFYSFTSLICKILFSPLEYKIHIFTPRVYNIPLRWPWNGTYNIIKFTWTIQNILEVGLPFLKTRPSCIWRWRNQVGMLFWHFFMLLNVLIMWRRASPIVRVQPSFCRNPAYLSVKFVVKFVFIYMRRRVSTSWRRISLLGYRDCRVIPRDGSSFDEKGVGGGGGRIPKKIFLSKF